MLKDVLQAIERLEAIQFSSYTKPLIAVEDVVKIIKSHMDDGWIPCSERLPEESLESVIGWDEYSERCCFVQYWGGRWILGDDTESVKIIAWQPIPEPYKAVKEDANE